MEEPVMIDSRKLTSRTFSALSDAGLLESTVKLRELVKSGDILRIKGFGEIRRKELMVYFALEEKGKSL
jgi:hypothetical protein